MKIRALFSRGVLLMAMAIVAFLQTQPQPGFAGEDGYGDAPSLPGQITGRVYVDLNNDGIHQMSGPMKEPGIPGVLVTLSGTDDLGNDVRLSMHTGKVGTYRFKNLRPGTYTVTERQPRQYLDGLDAKAGVVIPGSNKTDMISDIELGSGQTVEKNNFGELPEPGNLLSNPDADGPIGREGRGRKGGCHHGGCCGG
jgi:hypothetical protein